MLASSFNKSVRIAHGKSDVHSEVIYCMQILGMRQATEMQFYHRVRATLCWLPHHKLRLKMLTRVRIVLNLATRSLATATSTKFDGLSLTFASPVQSLYKDAKVKQVNVASYSGGLSILANHVPLLAVIKPGVVSVYEEDGTTRKYFVAAGTVTMDEDSSLLLLASEAVAVGDLDVSAASENLAAAASQPNPEAKIQAEVNLDSVK